MLELELKELCEEFISILDVLKENDIITEEELKMHSEKKIKFLEVLNN